MHESSYGREVQMYSMNGNTYLYMESNTKNATWRHLALRRPTPCPSGKSAQIGRPPWHSTIPCMQFVLHVRSCHVDDSTAKSPVILHLTWHSGSGGCIDHRAFVTTWQMATGLYLKCWLHGFWATYRLPT